MLCDTYSFVSSVCVSTNGYSWHCRPLDIIYIVYHSSERDSHHTYCSGALDSIFSRYFMFHINLLARGKAPQPISTLNKPDIFVTTLYFISYYGLNVEGVSMSFTSGRDGQSNCGADVCVAKKNSRHSNLVYPISLQWANGHRGDKTS